MRVRRPRWAPAAVLLATAGCTGVLGIDDDVQVDRDLDGVLGEADNCPGVANPDQRDTDRDGVGDPCDQCTTCGACATPTGLDADDDRIDDGCDACVSGPGDEDGDDLLDGCDPCPVAVEAGDLDGDGLGDACEPLPALSTITSFSGFGAGPEPFAIPGASGWSWSEGQVTGASSLAERELEGPLFRPESPALIEVGIGQPLNVGRRGLQFEQSALGSPINLVGCDLVRKSGAWLMVLTIGTETAESAPLAPGVVVRLQLVLAEDQTATCRGFDSATGKFVEAGPLLDPGRRVSEQTLRLTVGDGVPDQEQVGFRYLLLAGAAP